jgi:isocitrate lyase
MKSELVIVARTDALNARLIDSNVDPIDHVYILGKVEVARLRNSASFHGTGQGGPDDIPRSRSVLHRAINRQILKGSSEV